MQANAYFPTDACYPPVINNLQAGFAMPSQTVLPLPFGADSADLLAPLAFDDPEDWGILTGYPHESPEEYQNERYMAWASFPMPMPLSSTSFSETRPYSPPPHATSSTNFIPQNDSQRGTSVATPFAQTVRRRPRKSNRLSKEKRCECLQNDEYVLSFTAVQVFCSGCLQTIKLDDRDGAEYYLGFWLTHQRRCAGIREGITAIKRIEMEAAKRRMEQFLGFTV